MGNMLVAVTPCSFIVFPLMYWRDVIFSRVGRRNYVYVDTEVTREYKKIRDQIPPHRYVTKFLPIVISSFT
jgi:hypothetical protein